MHIVTQNCLLVTEKKSRIKISGGLSIKEKQITNLGEEITVCVRICNLYLRYLDVAKNPSR